MSSFLEKYQITENRRPVGKMAARQMSPEEQSRNKMSLAVAEQLEFAAAQASGRDIGIRKGDKVKMPRLFWSDVPGGYFFTPRFGNDFIFGKDKGISASSLDDVKGLLKDFGDAVERGEFDARLTEIASTRKGRGAGVKRKKSA